MADAERLSGNNYFKQGLWEDAITCYSNAITIDSNATAAYNNRAATYIKLKNFDAALEDCNRALSLEPDNTKALIRRAIVQEEVGSDMEAAAADLRKVLKLQPGNREAVQLLQKLDRFLPPQSRPQPDPQPAAEPQGPHDLDANINAVLIKAGAFHSRAQLLQLMQPFRFPAFGNETAELAHLRSLGWDPKEAGKFYGAKGHSCYFYVYGGQGQGAKAPNSAMAQACAKRILGDVVVVRSGPLGAYSELLTINEVADAVMFYEDKEPAAVFSERERARTFPGMASSIPGLHFDMGQGTTVEDLQRALREQLAKTQAKRKK